MPPGPFHTLTRSKARLLTAQRIGSLLLLPEIQLYIADFLDDRLDVACFCVALRSLGCAVQTKLSCGDPLFSLAMRAARAQRNHRLFDGESTLRWYVADCRMTMEGCEWLNEQYKKNGSMWSLQMIRRSKRVVFMLLKGEEQYAMLRSDSLKSTNHYEGAPVDTERLVRSETSGMVLYFKGSEERLVSVER